MPGKLVRKDVEELLLDAEDEAGLSVLAKKYHVSTQAMAYRLANLGLLA